TLTLANVAHLRAPRDTLAGLVLKARPAGSGKWTLGSGTAPTTRTADSFTLPRLAEEVTESVLLLQTDAGFRRIRLEVTKSGPLAVGHARGTPPGPSSQVSLVTSLASPAAVPATIDKVTEAFLATPWHLDGRRKHAPGKGTVSGTDVSPLAGTLVEVVAGVPSGATDPPRSTPVAADLRGVQILFGFGSSSPSKVVRVKSDYAAEATAEFLGAHDPDAYEMAFPLERADHGPARVPVEGGNVRSQLEKWKASLATPTARRFFVVGRTDDLAQGVNAAGNRSYNERLAKDRTAAAVAELVRAGIAATDISSRAEHEAAWAGGAPTAAQEARLPARFKLERRLAFPAGSLDTGTGGVPVWNSHWIDDGVDSAQSGRAVADPNRPPYRCAEIYADDDVAPPPAPAPTPGAGVPTPMIVPGPDGPAPALPATTTSTVPPTDYRVRLAVAWDSPTVVTAGDAIPTEAEATVAWKAAAVELPATASSGTTTLPKPGGQDFWEFVLRWTYDAMSGQTQATGSLSIPDGAVKWQSDALAGALAFGPAFAAILDKADVVKDPAGEFVLGAALIGAGAAVGVLLNSSGSTQGQVEIDKVTVDYRWNGSTRVSATVDYNVDLRVNASVAGSAIKGRIKLRYKGVGLRFDGKAEGLSGLAFTFDDLKVDVVDPGTWSLSGPLGNLLRVASSRMGNGSTWIEFDLQFALDLGVVRLEGATVRLTFDQGNLTGELRGLTAKVDIAEVLIGRGSVSVGDHGDIRALLALQIKPLKIGAYGALAIDGDFVAIEVGVQLPVGIPLANTGLGAFGFMGRFVANGARDVDLALSTLPTGFDHADPVQRELGWYVADPSKKYSRKSGQFALGFGAVIGTLPDGGFTFNAEGSIALGFPDVSVVFGIDAKLITQRKMAAVEGGTTTVATGGVRILGITVIDDHAVDIAIRANYEIKDVLSLTVPISAHFPVAQGGSDGWYIRIGTDNGPGRPGSPATITLLPTTLNVRAWAFVLVEERGILQLGGTLVPPGLGVPLDFSGFSVGFGAGFDASWSAGPFRLDISAFLVVGIGSKPLLFAGAAGIRGELDLVVLSVGVDGLVHFHVSPGYNYVQGHFCGHVDCFFFTVSGCVDVRFGDDPPNEDPRPESPLLGIDLCDHLAAVKGKTVPGNDGSGASPVWPDTIAVMRFAHWMDASALTGDFTPKVAEAAAISQWSGTTELKYAFRLDAVELHELTGADPSDDASWTRRTGPMDAAWWLPTFRRAAIVPGDPVAPGNEEGRELGLFHWDPRLWSRWLGDGSEGLPGDPAGTVDQACLPPPTPVESCAYGKEPLPDLVGLARFDAHVPPATPLPSTWSLRATLGAGLTPDEVAAAGALSSWIYQPGSLANLQGPAVVHGTSVAQGWRHPVMLRSGALVGCLPVNFRFSKQVGSGDLWFELCPGRGSQGAVDECDLMPGEGKYGVFVGESGTTYEGGAVQGVVIGGDTAVLVPRDLVGRHPRDAREVRCDVDPGGGVVRVVATDASGTRVGEAVTSGKDRQVVRIAGAAIRGVHLRNEGGKPLVFQICWAVGDSNPLGPLLLTDPRKLGELFVGVDGNGRRVPLKPEVVDRGLPPVATHVSDVRTGCPKFRLHLPGPGEAGGEAGWQSRSRDSRSASSPSSAPAPSPRKPSPPRERTASSGRA
ncbi:MAG: hypothetical protein WCS72_13330, partial [Deltaproteobacteria bacterium]